MSEATTSVLETEASAATIPTWREIPKVPDFDHDNNNHQQEEDGSATTKIETLLLQRGVWSEEQYASALELYQKFLSCQDNYIAHHISSALNCLDHALRLYGPESVICSFNGGKDAVVILHLLRAALAHYYQQAEEKHASTHHHYHQIRYRPRVIYFDHVDEFPQIRSFVRDTVEQYELEMLAFASGIKFSQGLELLVRYNYPTAIASKLFTAASSSSPKQIQESLPTFPMAFVLGTRTTDPNAGQQGQFSPSSHYMPPFLRVNPILEWTYGHVWHFLRQFKLPYCTLYDQGYTSLGTVRDTLPCPALAVPGFATESIEPDGEPNRVGVNGDGEDDMTFITSNSNVKTSTIPRYWPAYMLRDYEQERAGRVLAASSSNNNKEASTSKSKDGKSSSNNNTRKQPKASGSLSSAVLSSASEVSDKESKHSSLGNLSAFSEGRFLTRPKAQDGDDDDDKSVASSSSSSKSVISYATDQCQKTVGVLIIGDEILKGRTADTNTHAAALALREHNVVLKRVAVVSDDLEEIVNEINRLRKQVDVIITSGGVGPTHDDVTIKSVAAALGCDMILHEEMAQLLRDKMNPPKTNTASTNNIVEELTDAQIKMATLPNASKLRYLSDNPKEWPVLQCRNIFVLPGVPEYFSNKIRNVAEYLSCQLERSVACKVVLSVEESAIVTALNKVVENHPNVSFGSYPFVSHPDVKTVITVEGRLVMGGRSNSTIYSRGMLLKEGGAMMSPGKQIMDRNVQLALDELIQTLPKGSILRVDDSDDLLFD